MAAFMQALGNLVGKPAAETREATEAARDAGPRHVAIIMDGNGRWATERGLPRLAGHRRGASTVRRIVEACPDLGVRVLTLYAFSTENWRRPPAEVNGLMALFGEHLASEAARLHDAGVKMRFIGDPAPLPVSLRDQMAELTALTAGNDRLTLRVAINYGARAEITSAARRIADAVAAGRLAPDAIDEAAVAEALDAPEDGDPDLLIRTGGERRLSNFLLWQAAYAELAFAPELWPDFDAAALERLVAEFRGRARRFGGV